MLVRGGYAAAVAYPPQTKRTLIQLGMRTIRYIAAMALLIAIAIFVQYEDRQKAIKAKPNRNPNAIRVTPKTSPAIKVKPQLKNKLVEGIAYFEGFYSRPYRCPGGVLTIGHGFTKRNYVRRGWMSREEARGVLEHEVDTIRERVQKIVRVPLTEAQMCALVSFTYNCGEGALIKLVNTPGRLNSGNYQSVAEVLPLYNKASGKRLKGLDLRRQWELSLWLQQA